MQVSVETTLETCGWKQLRKSALSLLQQALQPPAKCAFAVTMSINPSSKLKFSEVPKVRFAVNQAVKCSPEKCSFVGNRPGNHALVTIQQMSDCVDTSMDTEPIQSAEIPCKT